MAVRVGVWLLFTGSACLVAGAGVSANVEWAVNLGNKKNTTGHSIAINESGYSYVTGIYGNKTYQSIGTHGWHSSGGEVFLSKISPTGKIEWQKFFGGDGIDAGSAVATFGDDVIYVAGYFSKTIHFDQFKLRAAESMAMRKYSPADGFVARFDAHGKVIWARHFGGPALDQAYGIASDKDGNVYVTGYFQGTASFGNLKMESKSKPDRMHDPDTRYGDVFVAKYDLRGNLVWVRQAGESHLNVAHSIAVAADGGAYITGFSEMHRILFGNITVADKEQPCFLAKYDRDGNPVWAQTTAGAGYYGRAATLALDKSSNLFVGGSFIFTQQVSTVTLTNPTGNNDVFVAKYAPSGTLLWCKQGGGASHDTCEALAVDASGRCFIAGSFDESAKFGRTEIHAAPHSTGVSGYESFVVGYDGAGNVILGKTIHRNANVKGMTSGADNEVYIIGTFTEPVPFGKTTLKPKRDFWGEAVEDTFVLKYRLGITPEH
ncbi:MAG: SBBP repeat-containing protein [Limisphaerales bacterium]